MNGREGKDRGMKGMEGQRDEGKGTEGKDRGMKTREGQRDEGKGRTEG